MSRAVPNQAKFIEIHLVRCCAARLIKRALVSLGKFCDTQFSLVTKRQLKQDRGNLREERSVHWDYEKSAVYTAQYTGTRLT